MNSVVSSNKLAVVLVSGGMDSCVCAAIANQKYALAFLHVSYGQRTERRERQAFEAIADHYHVPYRLVSRLDHLRQIGGSSLTDSTDSCGTGKSGTHRHSHQLCTLP